MTELLRLADKDFKAVDIKKLQRAILNTLETKEIQNTLEIKKKLNKEIKKNKEEWSGNVRTEKYNNWD